MDTNDKKVLISCRGKNGELVSVVWQPKIESLEEFARAAIANKDALPIENPDSFMALIRKLAKED